MYPVLRTRYQSPPNFNICGGEGFAVSEEVLDKYVGVYSMPQAPMKFTITREGTTFYAQPNNGQPALPLEATAEDKFKVESAGIVFTFDATKNQMIIKRGGGERIFTKEK